MNTRRNIMATASVGVLLAMSGCSGGDGIAALDRAATPDDQLPAHVSTDNLNVESVRRAVERDGVSYFISEPREGAGFCLIRSQDETDWVSSCSGGAGMVMTGQSSGEAVTFVPDGYSSDDLEDEGWTRIHENLFIRAQGTG